MGQGDRVHGTVRGYEETAIEILDYRVFPLLLQKQEPLIKMERKRIITTYSILKDGILFLPCSAVLMGWCASHVDQAPHKWLLSTSFL